MGKEARIAAAARNRAPRSNAPDGAAKRAQSLPKWRQTLGIAATAAMFAGSSAAADLSSQKGPAPATTYDWTGAYVGGHTSYAWGNSSWTAHTPGVVPDESGSFSLQQAYDIFSQGGSWNEGVQIGYNYEFANHIVLGAQTDVSFSAWLNPHGLSIGNSASLYRSGATYTDNVFVSGTARGRVGYAPGLWLFYATGGLAWTTDQYTLANANGSESPYRQRLGWVAGAGVEAPLMPHWTAFAEYLYSGFGNSTIKYPFNGQVTSNLSEQQFRIGLNYQLGDRGGSENLPQFALADPNNFAVHGQFTGTYQVYPHFTSPYQWLPKDGGRSLPGVGYGNEVTDLGLFVGYRPWVGAEIWANPELDQGFGVGGNSVGLVGFTNGEAFKLGQAIPYARLQRFFLRQTFNLGGETQDVPADLMQFAGSQTANRVVLTVGRFSVLDIFDTNRYANNAKTQFMNWGSVYSIPNDYGADAWAYTLGAAAEWYVNRYTFRLGYFDNAWTPQGGDFSPLAYALDPNFKNYQIVGEVEARYDLWGQPGKIKFTPSGVIGDFASFQDALAWGFLNNTAPSVVPVRTYRGKFGFTFNMEQQINPDYGVFVRGGYLDPRYEVFTATDCFKNIQFGLAITGTQWNRPNDSLGIAAGFSGYSPIETTYLNLGGAANTIADGKLPYPGWERTFETYYSYALTPSVAVTADYQLIANPAYNTQRGPVNVFGARAHWQF